jgi:hypothetical protein
MLKLSTIQLTTEDQITFRERPRAMVYVNGAAQHDPGARGSID